MASYLKAVILIGITYYMAAIYGSPALALLSYAELAITVFSLLVVLRERKVVECRLQVPITMTQQETAVKVVLEKVRNGKPWAGRICAELIIENTCLAQKRHIRQSVKGEGAGTFLLTLQDAGNYEISIKKVRIYDWLGLFYLTKKNDERAMVTVLPSFYPVNIRLTEAVRNFIGDAESYDSLRSGDDTSETFKLRAFQDGDKLKNIHWKLSAKMEELIVRESSMPKACSTVLLLDSMVEQRKFLPRKSGATDGFIKAVASLSFSIMDRGVPHFVAWYSRSEQDIVRARVDDEESFYTFLLYLLQDFDRKTKSGVVEMYREKYRAEVLLHHLLLKQSLQLYQKEVLIAELKSNDLEKSISEIELIL